MRSIKKLDEIKPIRRGRCPGQPGFSGVLFLLLGVFSLFTSPLSGQASVFQAPDLITLETVEPADKRLPEVIQMGGFDLRVISYDKKTGSQKKINKYSKLSGTAEVSFGCLNLESLDLPGAGANLHYFKVVWEVKRPDREIALLDALKIDQSARLNQKIPLRLEAALKNKEQIILGKEALLAKLRGSGEGIPVRFEDVAIQYKPRQKLAIATAGRAYFPAEARPVKGSPKLDFDGFSVHLKSLALTPAGATANARLQLPQTLFDAGQCGPAFLDLGEIAISPDCKFLAEIPGDSIGPVAIGNTGMVIKGLGFQADFRTTPQVTLLQGFTLGEPSGAALSNTGYLKGKYEFSNARIVAGGLSGLFTLTSPYSFQTINPRGYSVSFDSGQLSVSDSKITGGLLGPGSLELPVMAACKSGFTGVAMVATYSSLEVQDDLDLGGEIQFPQGARIGWGELTQTGNEQVFWKAVVRRGYFYLPAAPAASFSPDQGVSFLNFQISGPLPTVLAALESNHISGATIQGMDEIEIMTPDQPGQAPIRIVNNIRSWLRVGSHGIDGEVRMFEVYQQQWLGNPMRTGYEGNQAFHPVILSSKNGKEGMKIQYAASAVYDSEISGMIGVPQPCGISGLWFSDMELTSAANLVGGDIELPVGGLTLDYWRLPFVPTGDPLQAGVVSVRTGKLVFTAAGISEPVHFEKPFRLTWGEILADGNFNKFFIDFNSYGQEFDDIPFVPEYLMLSRFVPGATDGYLATCGSVHFNFFGPAFVNIRDTRFDSRPDRPFFGRSVLVPKTGENTCEPTNLHLAGSWEDQNGDWLALLDFPDSTMGYNETIQYGFIGTGEGSLSFIHSDGLDATIEIHGELIDICLTSTETHDLDLGLYAVLGSISQTMGCLRISGPQLQRISIQGYLEAAASTGFGILAPKSGFYAEVLLSVTPNSLTFSTSGDFFFSVASTAVDISGTIFLKKDYLKRSAEGEITGRIDCNAVIAGLSGEGQVTWYADPVSQYFQGKVKIEICSWAGSSGLEGGIFLGHHVPRSKAWVLYAGSDRFGVSEEILPDYLTGIFGYGQLSSSIQWYIFGGGFELYVGMGAFTESPPGIGSALALAGVGLPYVIGSGGVYVHGEILGGLVSAAAWGDLDLLLGLGGFYFEGSFGLEGCVLWVICASIEVRAGYGRDGFYIYSN